MFFKKLGKRQMKSLKGLYVPTQTEAFGSLGSKEYVAQRPVGPIYSIKMYLLVDLN